ncbi:VC2046/SO_2500 family protein [Aliiglaciecola litoralis]|uniref:Ribosomal S4P n=1 Tax=Aliiglaciecola litoralis TaxID=582857 RepID=A0ABN1LKZ3_9ALTE
MSASDTLEPIESTIAVSDLEWSGQINRAASQGRAFALLLSMLESDVLERPKLIASEEPQQDKAELVSDYPRPALSARKDDWQNAIRNSQLFARHPSDGKLFQTMHPQPLSIFNDAKRIDEEVLANCDFYTQSRLKQPADKDLKVDVTQLFDVLEKRDSLAATFV